MAKCNFTLNFYENAPEFTEKARFAVNQACGSFCGNESSGTFSVPTTMGTVKGDYFISGKKIDIAITNKPIFISCNVIEKKLKKYLIQVQQHKVEAIANIKVPVACSLNAPFRERAENLVQKAEFIIENARGTFTGDTLSGSFSVTTPLGSANGTYAISGQIVSIDIIDKPLLLSCNTIEIRLKQFIKKVEKISLKNGKISEAT